MNAFQFFFADIVYDCVYWVGRNGQERIYIKDFDEASGGFRAKKYGADYAVYECGSKQISKTRKGAWNSAAFREGFEEAFRAAYEVETMLAQVNAPAETPALPAGSPDVNVVAQPDTDTQRCWSCGGLYTEREVRRNGGDWQLDGCECGC